MSHPTPPAPPSTPPAGHPAARPPRAGAPRRAYRDISAPIAGGVAAGLAQHLGVPVLWVRGFFVATAFLGGFGLMLYAGLWMFLPADQHFEVGAPGLESATRTGKRPGRRSRLRDAGPAIAKGMNALASALPAMTGAMEELEKALDKMSANLPDPTYPKR